MSSIEQYAEKERELLEELLQRDTESIKTKKDIVKRLIEITRELFKLEYIPGLKEHDISSYVNGRLVEYNITFPRNQNWWALFEDTEKRNYNTGTNIEYIKSINHQCKFEDGKCDCGNVILNSIIYEEKIVDDEPIEFTGGTVTTETALSSTTSTAKPKSINTEMSDYLKRVYQNAQELAISARDLESKYQNNPKLQEAMDKSLKDIPKLIEGQKSVQALLLHSAKNADFRQKVGEFEKVKAIMLERAVYNTAKVAKLLSVTPKHMTNNIMTSNDEYMKNQKWFKTVFITLPKDYKKGDIFKLNLADWYGLQLERMDIGLHQQEVRLL